MSLKSDIEQMQSQLIPQIPEDALSAIMAATGRLVESGIADGTLKPGTKIPEFELTNAIGKTISSGDLLKDGPLVINFYRGAWCPYCNVELHALQTALPSIRETGAQLVAISPNQPDHSLSSIEKHGLSFEVLSDEGNKLARQFGLVFSLAEELRPIYTQFEFALPDFNGDASWELPIPATYVIDTDGTVVHAFINADYTQRQEPVEIVAILQKMRSKAAAGA